MQNFRRMKIKELKSGKFLNSITAKGKPILVLQETKAFIFDDLEELISATNKISNYNKDLKWIIKIIFEN